MTHLKDPRQVNVLSQQSIVTRAVLVARMLAGCGMIGRGIRLLFPSLIRWLAAALSGRA